MKFFNRDGKYNFVDENNVYLGYDSNQQCCETAGFFIDVLPLKDGEDISGKAHYSVPNLDNFRFDPSFFQCVGAIDDDSPGASSQVAVFRIVNDDNDKNDKSESLYIHLFNTHNGYYSHGFSFKQEDNKIQSGEL
jgi:hypothetical protein